VAEQQLKIGKKHTGLFLVTLLFIGCTLDNSNTSNPIPEHDKRYGIYCMDIDTEAVEIIYSSDNSLHRVNENHTGTALIFQEDFGDDVFTDSEVCLINSDGSGYRRITNNIWTDASPCWSPDGTQILYLSWPDYPDNTLDIFLMDSNGTNSAELYDSGYHDADCSWVGSKITFTRESQIWVMDDNGTNTKQVTDYGRAGEQGNADLPFGDYDPRLNPTGTMICFERMIDDQFISGNYDFYTININGTEETAITTTGWQQFIAEWSHAGDKLLFTVAAKSGAGIYDMYTMNPDGSDLTNITPVDWPAEFICSQGIFSYDDSKIYFVGEWWE